MVVLGCVVLIYFVELSFIFVIYILLLKKSGCVVFLECSAPSCDSCHGNENLLNFNRKFAITLLVEEICPQFLHKT